MTVAKNKPHAYLKPMRDINGRDISPAFLRRVAKQAVLPEQIRRTRKKLKRDIGLLPGRQRDGYDPQIDVMYEVGRVLMWVTNLATGYAYISLTELAALTSSDTFTYDESGKGHRGLGRTRRALEQFRALGHITWGKPLFDPIKGGRDRVRLIVRPSIFGLYGLRESDVADKMAKALTKERIKQKRLSEEGRGLPPETLDALAKPETAALLIGWWQWYSYTKATFRRFFLNVIRAGLHILPPKSEEIAEQVPIPL
jgi:hypothetical protein